MQRPSNLRGVWTSSDFAVCKIIAVLAKLRVQIFSSSMSGLLKQQLKSQVIRFAIDFIQHRTYRSVIRHVKTDLPKLLGFKQAEVFILDRPNKNLYCMSVRPNDKKKKHDTEEVKEL